MDGLASSSMEINKTQNACFKTLQLFKHNSNKECSVYECLLVDIISKTDMYAIYVFTLITTFITITITTIIYKRQ